jgi:hypothetical protein
MSGPQISSFLRTLDLSAVHMGSEDRDNRARDLVLDRENVVQLAVVPLSPAVGAGHGIDELRRDPDAVAAPPDAAFQHVTCAQLPADLSEIDRLALVLEGRISPDDQEVGKARQFGCNVLGNAVAEIVLLRVGIEIGERKDCNRRLVRERQFRLRLLRCRLSRGHHGHRFRLSLFARGADEAEAFAGKCLNQTLLRASIADSRGSISLSLAVSISV